MSKIDWSKQQIVQCWLGSHMNTRVYQPLDCPNPHEVALEASKRWPDLVMVVFDDRIGEAPEGGNMKVLGVTVGERQPVALYFQGMRFEPSPTPLPFDEVK